MEIEITLASGGDLQAFRKALQSQPGFAGSDAQLEICESRKKWRAIDPTLLVAIVGAAGTGLGALITGLFQIGQQVAAKKFVVETGGGQKLEVPANTPPDQIDHLLDKLSQMGEVKKISVE
ncbi:MAG TPA: hypothetical protein VN696_07145 [Pyrinomonadaceae bacterium]|nr:hypothetical protein [Pyrinomonadaceae bacterium]